MSILLSHFIPALLPPLCPQGHIYKSIPLFIFYSCLANRFITKFFYIPITLLQFSCKVGVRIFVTPWTAACQAPCPSPTPRACSNSYPSSHPTISSSVIPFSSYPQSFPASGSFQVSQFFASGGQNIGASASTSVLPMNIQDWFPLGLTSLISLQPKELSGVFFNTTVQKHQFSAISMVQLSHSYINYWKNHSFD